jgi:hypothetical protein
MKTVYQLEQWFLNFEDATEEARTLSERDRDYYDGKQWTHEEALELNKRGQQAIVVNRIRPKIKYLLGHEQKLRTDPKAYPRTPKHEDAANAATDALRYVCDANRFQRTKSAVFKDLVVEGYGGAEVTVVQGKDGIDIKIKRVAWDRIFFDPFSTELDFSDARYMGTVVWTNRDELKEMFPDKGDVIDNAWTDNTSTAETFDDKPRYTWVNTDGQRIKVVSAFYKGEKQQWYHCIFTGGTFLSEPELVPFVNEDGGNYCPLILQSANIDRDNNRYSEVREMVDIQDEINKRRSKALHLLNMRQTLGEHGAVDDINYVKREMAKPNGHIEIAPNSRFEILSTNDQMRGQFELLQESKNEIDGMGANAALMGKDNLGLSGRAIQAQQMNGHTELQPLLDLLRDWHLSVLKAVWYLIKQYWKDEKWVRVTDDENNLRWVGLNKPVTVGEQMQKDFMQLPPEEQQARQQELQMALQDPRANEIAQIENEIASLDVDIIIDEQPDIVTLQVEQFEQLTQMVQAGLPIPPDVIIEASSLRNKKALLEKIKGMNAVDPMAAQDKELAMRERAAKAVKDETQAELNTARANSEQVSAGVQMHTPLPAPQQLPMQY